MKFKKMTALLLSSAMIISLAGCGSSQEASTAAAPADTAAATTEAASTDDSSAAEETSTATADSSSNELMVIDNFNVAANYQGTQPGWFGQLIKEKFNIEINVIAPQVGGDALYQTRTAEGNLGDLLILEKSQWQDCIQTGLIKDISDKVYNGNLAPFKAQIDNLNGAYDGKIYGIPTEMMDTSPTSLSDEVIYSSPKLRWDVYNQIGAPEIADLEGLIDTLKKMQEAAPVNDDGDPCYGLSLWPDWDGGDQMLGIANVVQLTTWYGQKIKQSVILQEDGKTFIPLTDKNGAYYKILKFLNHAQLAGIVDPDSATQNWDSACAKMSAGQVYLEWYSWQEGFWDVGHMDDGRAHRVIPVADQKYYADADAYYGSGRVWAIGAGVDDAKYERIMELIEWLSSTEGLVYQHDGIEGFNYYIGDDGRYYTMNESALAENMNVPEEFGGAGYSDGQNKINQWLINAAATNPETGEMYGSTHWSTYKEKTDTDMVKEWRKKYDAENPVDYFKKNDKLVLSPNISVPLESDSADIQVIRNQCNEEVCNDSWVMIYAKDDAEFDALWDDMTTNLDGLGFQELMEWDKRVYQVEIDAKNAAK